MSPRLHATLPTEGIATKMHQPAKPEWVFRGVNRGWNWAHRNSQTPVFIARRVAASEEGSGQHEAPDHVGLIELVDPLPAFGLHSLSLSLALHCVLEHVTHRVLHMARHVQHLMTSRRMSYRIPLDLCIVSCHIARFRQMHTLCRLDYIIGILHRIRLPHRKSGEARPHWPCYIS